MAGSAIAAVVGGMASSAAGAAVVGTSLAAYGGVIAAGAGLAAGALTSKALGGSYAKGAAAGLGGYGIQSGYLDPLIGQLPAGVRGSVTGAFSSAGGGLQAAGQLYGLYQSQQSRKIAEQAQQQANPFGAYREGYAQQLQGLAANPASVTSLPGYQFGMDAGSQAIARRMAASGYAGSGNEAIALQRYGSQYAGQYLSAEQARLAQLAGANIAPNPYPGAAGQTSAMGDSQYFIERLLKTLGGSGAASSGAPAPAPASPATGGP